MRDFRQVKVWQHAHRLTLEIYHLTKNFPKEELFTLTNQMRRSAASIPTNIAEGCGRGTNKDYAHFLQISLGSTFELDYQLLLASDLNYISNANYGLLSKDIDSLKKQLAVLLQKVRAAS